MPLPFFEKKIEMRCSGLEALSVLGWLLYGGEPFLQKFYNFRVTCKELFQG